ncbi:hypothetical protein ElyMa_001530000 [Elysia marginata]|uniref:Uncharacterized protein n=1 Tax=Elysia marginata TaxID=1093978 RepID=A0AAV4J9Z1_9GAST|nr:hypothetical protein ElyMa_001530000 [Elysia marginata]
MAALTLPSPYNNVCTPIVSAEPAYRGHRLKGIYSKPKSANEMEDSVTLLDLSDISVKCSTPYRLPRIPPPDSPTTTYEGGDKAEPEEKIFGRFGYEDVVKMPELGPSIRKALINPHSSLAQRYRQAGLGLPKFTSAAITPAYRHAPFAHHAHPHPHSQQFYNDEDVDEEYDQHSMFKSVDLSNPSATPVSRSVSPCKSIKSIHWALGNEKNPNFDTTGQVRAQGPFSRCFQIRCTAPPNWLRMKLGRSRTMVH